MFESLQPGRAEKLLESLRLGIPPAGFVEEFTVGRKGEIEWLDSHLIGDETYSLLLKANYGSGKTHLLQWIREKALHKRFGVSLLALDAKSGVRFNRMDQIFGSILRNIQVPLPNGPHGNLEQMLDLLAEAAKKARTYHNAPEQEFWGKVTNNWRWDYSKKLKSPPFFIALRAWASSDSPKVRQMVMDWLTFPDSYRIRKKDLYQTLVEGLRRHFRTPDWHWQTYKSKSLIFSSDLDYKSCWDALEDIHRMLVASGMTGMAVLFDEFEDVLTNLRNIKYQETAFRNLFRFTLGDRFMPGNRFTGKTFFAVTPDFVRKCKMLLLEKGPGDFDCRRFDELPTFSMSPLTVEDLLELAESRIVPVHERAYGNKCREGTNWKIKQAVLREARSAVQDRTRQAIKAAVQVLDDTLE